MEYEENIRAILETNFSETKEEIIDIALKLIVALKPTMAVVETNNKPIDNKQHEVELKKVVCLIKAAYENDKDKFNQEVEELIKELWDSNMEVADYLSGLRYNNGWTPM